jgi:CRP-like cAMP-binding protein
MISPEVLRRYPFFSFMNHGQLREMAMISEEIEIGDGKVLFSVGDEADALYLLREGAIDLHYIVIDEHEPLLRKDFYVGNVNPGEVVGVSAVIEPFQYKAAAIINGASQLLKIEAAALRNLCEDDQSMAYGLIYQIAKAAMDKLHATRVQLAGSKEPL